MKSLILTPMILGFALSLTVYSAQASEELTQKHGCAACHALDKKKVGPAWRDVAKKYKGKDVESTLAAKVKSGGKGNWGNVPMPPQTKVSDADLQAILKWVLAQ